MKQGIIVYLANSSDLPEGFDPSQALTGLGFPCDRAVAAAAAPGYLDVHDAWCQLLQQGMHAVLCIKARVDAAGRLHCFGSPLRLCG